MSTSYLPFDDSKLAKFIRSYKEFPEPTLTPLPGDTGESLLITRALMLKLKLALYPKTSGTVAERRLKTILEQDKEKGFPEDNKRFDSFYDMLKAFNSKVDTEITRTPLKVDTKKVNGLCSIYREPLAADVSIEDAPQSKIWVFPDTQLNILNTDILYTHGEKYPAYYIFGGEPVGLILPLKPEQSQPYIARALTGVKFYEAKQ